MTHAIFELDQYRQLPLWAQVLMAARLVRRALKELPADDDAEIVRLIAEACDAATQCATHGSIPRHLEKALRNGIGFNPTAGDTALWSAMYFLIDATAAAQASESFSAADAACSSSVGHCFAHIGDSPEMSPLRVQILLAADLDLLRFACKDSGVGTYDAIPQDVLLRLTPA
jgi:hypothetical protein